MKPIRINCCIIVKDDTELVTLKKAIDTVIPFVEGVYVTATGEAVSGIEEYCKTDPKLHYSYFKWVKDFSAARNFNFSQAPQSSDYLLWIDADDQLVGGSNMVEVAKMARQGGKNTIFFPYWYGCTFNGEPSYENLVDIELDQRMRERLLKPGTFYWKGRLHETPMPIGRNDGKTYSTHPWDEENLPVAIMHTSSIEKAEDKLPRNMEILELQLQDEKEAGRPDPRTLLYLMKIYAEVDDKEKQELCIDYGKEYLKNSGWDEERGVALEQMGIAAGRLGDQDGSVDYFMQSLKEWPTQPIVYMRLATALFNLKRYRDAEYWLDLGSKVDMEKYKNSFINMKALKQMYSELKMRLYFRDDFKDVDIAFDFAKLYHSVVDTQESFNQLAFLEDQKRLNDACKDTDKLCEYLVDIGYEDQVVKILDELPLGITVQPFAQKLRQKFTPPRKWDENEICYFASFNQKHFEEWSPKSLEKGIGGSETAVVELAKTWTTMGYKVTVYGDPGEYQGMHDGVLYLPWYYFNRRDHFNIFIQWRSSFLAPYVKSKIFLADLHDIFSPTDISQTEINAVDKFMVKSFYHRNLAPKIPDNKFMIVGNGI